MDSWIVMVICSFSSKTQHLRKKDKIKKYSALFKYQSYLFSYHDLSICKPTISNYNIKLTGELVWSIIGSAKSAAQTSNSSLNMLLKL